MKRNIICVACVLLAAFVLGLTGLPFGGEIAPAAGEDRLIGVFVTTEYLDLFDMDRYAADNINSVAGGGQIAIDGDTAAYEGRLYATLQEQTLTSEDTGETTTMQEYAFADTEGIPYFCARMGEGDSSYIATGGDSRISDGHTAYSVTDEEESVSLSGTIYATPRKQAVFFFNPVYQSPDGRVYAMSGQGMSSDSMEEGSAFSQTMDASSRETINGETKTNSISIKVSVSMMYPPERITVVQMDANHQVLCRSPYVPGSLPDTLVPAKAAAYLLVETEKAAPDGGTAVSRRIYEPSAETMETYFCREDGILEVRHTALQWGDAADMSL